jgi:hypothetical protein
MLARFTHLPKYQLNEEKYINERRKFILENLFGEIDFTYLENMKNDFIERVWESWDYFEPII